MTQLFALAALLAASPASAGPVPSFENLLNTVRQNVLETRKEQIQAKDARTAQDLQRLARDVERLTWDARRLKDRILDIRRRASRALNAQPPFPGRPGPGRPAPGPGRPGDPRRPGNPGGPGRDSDPFLRQDVQRLVWDLKDFTRTGDDAQRELDRLTREAGKDPLHVEPAQQLERAARDLEGESRWLESEGRWAGMDLRRAGYNFEAWDIERGTADGQRRAQDLARGARTLVEQVRP